MTGLLIDTNAYAAIAKGREDALNLVCHANSLYISIVSIGELYSGFVSGTKENENRQLLERFLHTSGVRVLPVVDGTAEAYGMVYKATQAAGRPIPTNDIWIAAAAIQHSLLLFTYDRHFAAIPGLRTACSLNDIDGASRGA